MLRRLGHEDGLAKVRLRNLMDVVNFYNQRFQMGLSSPQMQDLIKFLKAL